MTTIPVCEIRDWTQLNIKPAPRNGKRVVVAMSGGVDSSVAALMLHEQGYEVVGVMLRLWAGEQGVVDERTGFVHNRCCTPDAVEDARALCDAIGAPFFLKNLEEPFREAVVEPFIDAYLHGKTPNPCLHCNRTVRFTHLLNIARGLGADYLATGHYARVVKGDDGLYHLYKGVDANKDQSYVLYSLTQEKLAHLIFPVGHLTKPQVRELARQYGMPLAEKPESQEICFIATGDYRQFLRRHAPPGALKPGPIVHVDGRELGRHEGLPFYTLGQRRGLGIPWHEPLYVVAKDHARNALIVGPRDALRTETVEIEQVNWILGEPDGALDIEVRIRYKAPEVPAIVEPLPGARARVTFPIPQQAVTPGQGLVFYDGDECLGGGLIV
ncbi:MAG: tRNA 2-thiouridine(34) synthase MnmA [Ardenticatenia bacterium]|nr:MAG: tRNA 2-thiouridine(34) synthase MnmA [Ardenticatenia bacterium]